MNDDEWVKSVREKVTIARAEIARGEELDGETVVNELLDRLSRKWATIQHRFLGFLLAIY
jgi:hypothetical protein